MVYSIYTASHTKFQVRIYILASNLIPIQLRKFKNYSYVKHQILHWISKSYPSPVILCRCSIVNDFKAHLCFQGTTNRTNYESSESESNLDLVTFGDCR